MKNDSCSDTYRSNNAPLTPEAWRKVSLKLSARRPERPSHFWTFQSVFCFAAVAFFCGSSIAQSTTGEFDPWKGIEKNGRIPKIDKPEDLTNPERWRYIPEGRLKPGNVFQRFLVSSFVAPFFFRNSDVGFGGGIASSKPKRPKAVLSL